MRWRTLLVCFAFVLTPGEMILAQTCSCARTPIGGSLNTPSVGAGDWQFGLTYEYHPISDIYVGTQEIKFDTRQRISHSVLVDATWGMNDRWTISTQLTLSQQERRSPAGIGTGEFLRTRGIGDGLLLLKYNALLPTGGRRTQLTVGSGIKVPLGSSSLSNNGTLISADMQPGSGSWDGLFLGYLGRYLNASYATSVFGTLSYRINGSSDRGGSFPNGYRIGDELVSDLGISMRRSAALDLVLAVRLRHSGTDRANGETVPNSGGTWLNVAPALNLNLTPSFTARLSGQAPIYRKVDGLQATTSYTLSVAVFYTITQIQEFGIKR